MVRVRRAVLIPPGGLREGVGLLRPAGAILGGCRPSHERSEGSEVMATEGAARTAREGEVASEAGWEVVRRRGGRWCR